MINTWTESNYSNPGPINITTGNEIGKIHFQDSIEISFEMQSQSNICYPLGTKYCEILKIGYKDPSLPSIPILFIESGVSNIRSRFDGDRVGQYQTLHIRRDSIFDGNYHSYYYKYSQSETIIKFDDTIIVNWKSGRIIDTKFYHKTYSIFVCDYVHNPVNGNIRSLTINTWTESNTGNQTYNQRYNVIYNPTYNPTPNPSSNIAEEYKSNDINNPSITPSLPSTIKSALIDDSNNNNNNVDDIGDETVASLLLSIVSIILLFVIIVIIFVIYHKLTKKLNKTPIRFESDQIEDRDCISNGLVVIIGIGNYHYDQTPTYSDSKLNRHSFEDLPVDIDIKNLQNTFNLLNYTIIPNKLKTAWTEHEITKFLKNDVVKELFDDDNQLKYDGLIVCVSCHGVENKIITSDFKTIQKAVIHRLISHQFPKVRQIPRIFLFDSCQGNAERKSGRISLSKSSITWEQTIEEEKAKGVRLVDIMVGNEWTLDSPNPDYKLVEIHAANIGFQAKCNFINGSYLIHRFTEKLQQDIIKKDYDKKSLGTIFEEIQNELHDKGRQQTINTFNNNTRHLIFKKNNNIYNMNKINKKKEVDMLNEDITNVLKEEHVDNDDECPSLNPLMLPRITSQDGYVNVDDDVSDNDGDGDIKTRL